MMALVGEDGPEVSCDLGQIPARQGLDHGYGNLPDLPLPGADHPRRDPKPINAALDGLTEQLLSVDDDHGTSLELWNGREEDIGFPAAGGTNQGSARVME